MVRSWFSLALYCVLVVIVTSSRPQRLADWIKSTLPAVDDASYLEAKNELASDILREVLAERNFDENEIDDLIGLFRHKLGGSPRLQKKSGWKYPNIPIQTRFAAFGQKLVPGRMMGGGDHGPTILRYGRSLKH
ncbi:hypothetical protein SNE40_000383 [Patella caerulea]|uniref:Uncharacterized protein n=1 Tax=Patella caerulea TaxID=87958 RepID=A0AAN8KGH4_PATCE